MSKNFKLITVKGAGNLSTEHVWLQALEELNVGDYVLMDDTFTSNHEVSNKDRHLFVFPSKVLKKGEFVSLRTRDGTDGPQKAEDGTAFYAFHWKHKKTVWNKDGDTAHLLYAPLASRQAVKIK